MNRALIKRSPIVTHICSVLVILCMVILTATSGVDAAALSVTITKFADAPSSNIVVDPQKYYGAQGTAFDTYTGKDGYSIAISKLASNNGKLQVVHYKHTASGIKEVKSVIYTKKQLDHANDATIFKYGNVKWMFVARGGAGNKTAVMIKLSEFDKGKAKVYPVSFSKLDTKSGTDLRGITYVGKKTVKVGKKNVKKDVFIVEVGRRMNLVYLKSLKNNKAVLEKVDSQRIQAPKIGSRECTAQGVTYQNGNVYVSWGDEGKGGANKIGKITSIGYGALFKGSTPDKARSFAKTWTRKCTYTFTPEAVYFTKLEGKLPMYISCNTGLEGGRDYIYVSKQKY